MSTTGTWTVLIDNDRCIGSGSCTVTAPHVFDVDDSCHAVLIGPVDPDDEAVRDAVADCPTGALTLTEEPAP